MIPFIVLTITFVSDLDEIPDKRKSRNLPKNFKVTAFI